MIEVDVDGILADQGSVVVFGGTDLDTGQSIRFAEPAETAQALADVLAEHGGYLWAIQPWQVL